MMGNRGNEERKTERRDLAKMKWFVESARPWTRADAEVDEAGSKDAVVAEQGEGHVYRKRASTERGLGQSVPALPTTTQFLLSNSTSSLTMLVRTLMGRRRGHIKRRGRGKGCGLFPGRPCFSYCQGSRLISLLTIGPFPEARTVQALVQQISGRRLSHMGRIS